MSANNNQHTCSCDNEICLTSCLDKDNTWDTQEEFDCLPDDAIILTQLSQYNDRLDKFDSVPLLHTKGFIKKTAFEIVEELKKDDAVLIENLYEDIKKYNVKSAENITMIESRPSKKYALWRKWIFQYIAYKLYKGYVMKGVLLDKEKFKKFSAEVSPMTIGMLNDDGDACLLTTAHYYKEFDMSIEVEMVCP